MGDIVDWMLEKYGWDDDAPSEFEKAMQLSDEELRKQTEFAQSEKIQSIRNWPKPLSRKQRACLARWIVDIYGD